MLDHSAFLTRVDSLSDTTPAKWLIGKLIRKANTSMAPSRSLIVDDDARVLQVLSQIVMRQLNNVLVDTALGAQTALQLLESTTYDTVFTDFMMPERGRFGKTDA